MDDLFSARELKMGEDFEVVSFMVLDHEFEFYTIDHYFGINSNKLLGRMNLATNEINDFFCEHQKIQNVMSISKTPYPEQNECNVYFYKMKGEVNFDYAISVGLGVVKMLKGKYKEEYLLYNFSSFVDDERDIQIDSIEEMLRLKMYAQLTYPTNFDDKRLEKLLRGEPNFLAALIPGDSSRILKILTSIYNSKKGKVIPFIKK